MAGPAPPKKSSSHYGAKMAYAVEFTRRAERDLNDLYDYINAEHSELALRWLNGLEAITTLKLFPRRCPRAPESRISGMKLRHLLYGSDANVYRVLFEIDETQRIVWILTIRHAARDLLIKPQRFNKKS
jgi:plasmid stabilization system protein ParE